MNIPYVVVPDLDEAQCKRWVRQFEKDGRHYAEGMWRRSHDMYTHRKFDTDPADRRRRLVHFIDTYGIITHGSSKHLAITESYLYICSTLPSADVLAYWKRHFNLAVSHGWTIDEWSDQRFKMTQGDLIITGKLFDRHPNDRDADVTFPKDYKTVEIIVRSSNEHIPKDKRETPWGVWKNNYRRPITRHDPILVDDLHALLPYFPMHVELGCGPSLEAGIPPLSQLHHIYSAADYSTGHFLFGKDDTLLERVISNPKKFYECAAEPYRTCFTAPLTPFYQMLGDMHRRGLILNPLINNNFDGLAKLAGLEELYIRRYETTNWIPDIPFDKRAKALLVVGSHADRRLVRVHARQSGLQVIYVDPEGYTTKDGSFQPYPLEALAANDMLVRMTAREFTEAFYPMLPEALEDNPVLATSPAI